MVGSVITLPLVVALVTLTSESINDMRFFIIHYVKNKMASTNYAHVFLLPPGACAAAAIFPFPIATYLWFLARDTTRPTTI